MVDPTALESGDTIERLKEMFGAGGGVRRVTYEVIDVTGDSVTVEPAADEDADAIELAASDLRDGWDVPDERE